MLAEPAPAPHVLDKTLSEPSNLISLVQAFSSNTSCKCQDCVTPFGFQSPRKHRVRNFSRVPPIPEEIELKNSFSAIEPASADDAGDLAAMREIEAAIEEEAAIEWARSLESSDGAIHSAPPFGGHSIGR